MVSDSQADFEQERAEEALERLAPHEAEMILGAQPGQFAEEREMAAAHDQDLGDFDDDPFAPLAMPA